MSQVASKPPVDPTMTGQANRPVDLVHLGAMTQGDSELEREVLGIFLAQAPIHLAAIRSAASSDARRRAIHTLKGAARGIGAWRLAEIAEVSEAGRDTQEVVSETERVCAFIRRLA